MISPAHSLGTIAKSQPPAKPEVGFIGLGDQDTPIAQAITDGGYPLHAWARRPESLQALDGFPHTAHATVAELAAASDVIALCLREDSDNVQVAVAGGLLEHMRRGTVLVNHGTGLPQAARAGYCRLPPASAAARAGPVSETGY